MNILFMTYTDEGFGAIHIGMFSDQKEALLSILAEVAYDDGSDLWSLSNSELEEKIEEFNRRNTEYNIGCAKGTNAELAKMLGENHGAYEWALKAGPGEVHQ